MFCANYKLLSMVPCLTKIVNMVNYPSAFKYFQCARVSMLKLAFSLKHHCTTVQSNRATSMATLNLVYLFALNFSSIIISEFCSGFSSQSFSPVCDSSHLHCLCRFPSFHETATADSTLQYLIAFLVLLTTVKLWHLLRLNPKMNMITATLQRAWSDISGFLLIIVIMFLAYSTAVSILPLYEDLPLFQKVFLVLCIIWLRIYSQSLLVSELLVLK